MTENDIAKTYCGNRNCIFFRTGLINACALVDPGRLGLDPSGFFTINGMAERWRDSAGAQVLHGYTNQQITEAIKGSSIFDCPSTRAIKPRVYGMFGEWDDPDA